MAAYRMNWVSSPALMRPCSTAWAPSQSTNTIAPNTSTIASAVRVERARVRRTAAWKASSVDALKRADSKASRA